ncbi:MAG: hypothetical protein ACT4OP_11230 [Actinomycetota bacterium]
MNRTAKVLAMVLTVVLVSAGIYLAYQSGFDAGAINAMAAQDGRTTTVVIDRGWGRGGFGFFPFFPLLFPLLFLFLVFGVFRPWRWRGPAPYGYGPNWGPSEHIEKRLDEWHEKAHGQQGRQSE